MGAPVYPRRFADRLASGPPLLLDGATGTELERRGARCDGPLWSVHALLEDPAMILRIHRDYVAAGAEILTANTFRTQARALARGGLGERAAELTQIAIGLARSATGVSSRGRCRRSKIVGDPNSRPTTERSRASTPSTPRISQAPVPICC
jgi:S-methylmethionine-dependent homocysteine/selenocysteine methylase